MIRTLPDGTKLRTTSFIDITYVAKNSDDSGSGRRSNLVYALPKLDPYLQVNITEVDTTGVVTLTFSEEINIPTNDTWFVEQLTRIIETENIHTGEIVETPAFEVEFLQSYAHGDDVQFDFEWEFIEWVNNRQMTLQLLFGDDTKKVSMQTPPDYVNVTFWDQELFMTPGGRYVEK